MKRYDYALLGGGAAGLSLALALVRSPLRDRSILIVDKDQKNRNDRTWSIWVSQPTPYDAISYGRWDRMSFISDGVRREFGLSPYRYQTLRGIDFYRFVQEELGQYPNVEQVLGSVEGLKDNPGSGSFSVDGIPYQANWIFDSRVTPGSLQPNPQRFLYLKQHFKGWEIETPAAAFDPCCATLFDLRTRQRAGLCFFYVLPFSPRRALVEYTLFSADLLDGAEYEQELKRYIEQQLKIKDYRIVEEETGVIPMTDHPFPRRLGKRILATGTRGGRIKPSTGYAFNRIQRDSQAIVSSLSRKGHPFDVPGYSFRRRFYDSLLLEIISNQGPAVKPIFEALFAHNPVQRIFRFLDEQSTLYEDLLLISSLPSLPFLKALLAYLRRGGFNYTPPRSS